MNRSNVPVQMVGRQFGRLVVLHQTPSDRQSSGAGKRTHRRWMCRCACGSYVDTCGTSLRLGRSKSCGCLSADVTKARSTTHGKSESVEFRIWAAMRARCTNPNSSDYESYGGRGTRVCDRWLQFENFLDDMGLRPESNFSIDRIDNKGHYEPSNCRWATRQQQANNRTTNIVICFRDRKLTVAGWARETGLSYKALIQRYHAGWTPERMLTEPVRGGTDEQ